MIVRSIIAFESDFEHSGVSITWVIMASLSKLAEIGISRAIPGYPSDMCRESRHIPSCTDLSSVGISQDIPRYPKTRFLYWDIPLQVFCIGLSQVNEVIPG